MTAPDVQIATLIEGLESAEAKTDPRQCAGEALLAVYQFLRSIPLVADRDLDAPIFNLIIALDDLSNSTVSPMLKGGKSQNRHQAPTARKIMKAYCSNMVDRLLAKNHTLENACKVVAGALSESVILRGQNSSTWEKVRNWRNDAMKLDAGHQERMILDALRAEIEGSCTPAEVVASIRRLDAKIGRFA